MAQIDSGFKLELDWEGKAAHNPLYAVMSIQSFKDKSEHPEDWSEEDLAAFFAKGRAAFEQYFKPTLSRAGIAPGASFVVEYGSGMGRVLRAVHEAGYSCGGIDISPTMLKHSAQLTPAVHKLWALDDEGDCQAPSDCADFVYSYAVIQHISRLSRVRKAIQQMARVCKPGGLLRLQIKSPEHPFRSNAPGRPLSVFNGEDKTVLVFPPKAGEGPDSGIQIVEHNHWHGIPLAISTMRSLMDEFGLEVTGMQQDVRAAEWVWFDARKAA